MNRTLQYNTEKANLQMSEYGRIIQEMANHCLTIEDRQERLACAQHIVSVMASLAQEKASNPEVQSKLWNHLALISDFKLDIDYPVEIIPQAEAIAAEGIKEIVLTGVNTGDFGKSTGETFFDLIKQLNAVEGIERYRISSIEPNLLTEEMIDWITSGTKFLPHYHIPLQSGCDTILREMGRRYDTAAFAHKIQYIRERSEVPGGPRVFFGIDVIVGFPGETDELFEETYTFLRDVVRPAFIHIFPYSKRAGTPAAERKDQVQDSVKTQRVQRLEKLCSELHEEFMTAHKGMKAKVLFESTDRQGMMEGYTENYIRVSQTFDPEKIGHIVEVTI